MKFYSDRDRVIMVQSVATASTFASSMVGVIKQHILKAFPKKYFQNIYVDTSETFQEQNKADLNNKHLYKIKYPNITITPQLSLDTPVGGMKNILMSSPNLFVPRDLQRHFPCILRDPDGKYDIYYSADYTTLNIRFRIVTDSFIQSTNIGYYLKSRFDESTFRFLNGKNVAVEVPPAFINAIAKIENIFGANSSGKAENALELRELETKLLAMTRGNHPIIRKRNLNTGKQAYFFDKNENLLCLFTDLDIPEGVVRDNGGNGEYEITFRVQASGWWVNALMMSVDASVYQADVRNLAMGVSSYDGNGFYSTSIGSPIALDFKPALYFASSALTADGKTKTDAYGNAVVDRQDNIGQNVIHETLVYDGTREISTISIAPLLQDDLKRVYSFTKMMADSTKNTEEYNVTRLLHVIARGWDETSDAASASIDYANLYAEFDTPAASDVVLDVFVNKAEFATMASLMESSGSYSDDALISVIRLNTDQKDEDGDPIQIRAGVYAFKSDDDMLDASIDKSLRVYTELGVGYIGVVPEDDPQASRFRICLGVDRYGSKVVRAFKNID
jgi:hypothetical protein